MSLLECLVALALALVLLGPLIKNTGEYVAKQTQVEKTQLLTADAERALELIGRAIRMAGYQHFTSAPKFDQVMTNAPEYIRIDKGSGYRGSDSITIRHGLSRGVDYDCIGNILSIDRSKNHLAQQGFLVNRQASTPKGIRTNGGSLICQSLDRQGRLQNTTLMNGVNHLSIEALQDGFVGAFKVRIEMTDGLLLKREFERTFARRNGL